MEKNNAMLAKLENKYRIKYELEFNMKVTMLLQMAQDAAMIAAHDVPSIGLGPGRAQEYAAKYRETLNGLAQMMVVDAKDDPEIVYTKEKWDQRLKQVVGESNFIPWEERYGEN